LLNFYRIAQVTNAQMVL